MNFLVLIFIIEGVVCTAADYPFFNKCDPAPPSPCIQPPCMFECPRKNHLWKCGVTDCRNTEYYQTHCAHVAAVVPTPKPTPTVTPTKTPTPLPTKTPTAAPTKTPTPLPCGPQELRIKDLEMLEARLKRRIVELEKRLRRR